LDANGQQISEACIAVAMKPFGIGEETLDGFPAAAMDGLAHAALRLAPVRSRASAQTWRVISL